MLKPISVVVKTDSKDRAHKVGGGAHRLYSITIFKYKKYQTKINVLPPVNAIPMREFKTQRIRRRFYCSGYMNICKSRII